MLDADPIIAVLTNGLAPPAVRADALRRLRRHAEQHLRGACERVGISACDLADNDHAAVANLVFQKSKLDRSEKHAAALMRWCIEAEERGADALVTTRIVQALRDMEGAILVEGRRAARESSKAARREQADADAAPLAELFAAAWRSGMGRVGLQAAAMAELRERERRLRDKLITAQQVGNKPEQRRLSAQLQALQRQTVLCTLHRAGKWLQRHRGGT